MNDKVDDNKVIKSKHAERDEHILAYWKDNNIFQKTLEKNKGTGKEFIFYEGPPTANGHPGIHHLEARAFKDAIPRYKTMRGYYVPRKGGWDTHGLPVELLVEKTLGLKSKKEVEQFGISAFNQKCRESVWQYVKEWEQFTERMGYWVDLKDPYVTYKPNYIESIWNIISKVEKDGHLYKDYKIVPWCPRCGTGLSSHELAQGYETDKDLSLYVKFKIKNPEKIGLLGNVYLIAWTTTPWTLPGNLALAVGEKLEYISLREQPKAGIQKVGEGMYGSSNKDETYIVEKTFLQRLEMVMPDVYTFGGKDFRVESFKSLGKDLIGLEYEPLYAFIKDSATGTEKEKLTKAFKVYAGDFVTTADGTGIVHIAPMYGQDDFDLGTKVGLPKYHLVNDDGTFKSEVTEFAGLFVKDPNTDVAILKSLIDKGF
jgi:isoleucyl-tRNA synthetase